MSRCPIGVPVSLPDSYCPGPREGLPDDCVPTPRGMARTQAAFIPSFIRRPAIAGRSIVNITFRSWRSRMLHSSRQKVPALWSAAVHALTLLALSSNAAAQDTPFRTLSGI